MTDFDAIDALLAGAKQEAPLPSAEERRALREGLDLSRTQLAQALNVSPFTVGGWESGRDPSGEVREKYAYFLEGARTKPAAFAAGNTPAENAAAEESEADAPGHRRAGHRPPRRRGTVLARTLCPVRTARPPPGRGIPAAPGPCRVRHARVDGRARNRAPADGRAHAP